MSQTCRDCSRVNPSEAAYCYYDGVQLNGRSDLPQDGSSVSFSNWVFPSPFVLPSGEMCRNFPQLARACRKNPSGAIDLLTQGFLESFLGSLGRVDLALAAREAGRHPDHERGLDEFLAKLPGTALEPAKLEVEPGEIDLGNVSIGEERRFELTLRNSGDRLLWGKVAADDCAWLVLGDSGTAEKLFQFVDQTVIPVRIRADRLRAYTKPQKGEIVLESNGGNVIVTVAIMVPIKPFPDGVLAGSLTPRQLAEKAKANQAPAAALIENGVVARWYEMNGWTYPVQGPPATGIAAIQQLFEALGLVKAPKVEIAEPAIALGGRPGERLEHILTVTSPENRPVYAHAVSDQPWLTLGKTTYKGRTASLPLIVDAIPHEPGKTLHARIKVTANGNKRFDVPLVLAVADAPPVSRSGAHPTASLGAPTAPTEITAVPAPVVPAPSPFADLITPTPTAAPAPTPVAVPAPAATAQPVPAPGKPSWLTPERRLLLFRLLPVAIVVIGLLTTIVLDLFFRDTEEVATLPPIDENARIVVDFHDAAQADDGDLRIPTLRFGVSILGDPANPKDRTHDKRLTFDRYGRTCNTCVLVDTTPFLLGDTQYGRWEVKRENGKEQNWESLGTDPLENNRKRIGRRSTWLYSNPLITIDQQVEVIPGGVSADGKSRVLDTCLVSYVLSNKDRSLPFHKLGLRYLLDTFIGDNDGVPFTIPGDKELCDTVRVFDKPENVPDFISAMERTDVNNPGTVAHVSLKVGGGLEAPSEVRLGVWPNAGLKSVEPSKGNLFKRGLTLWDVPAVSMRAPNVETKTRENPDGELRDSAVTLYWKEKELFAGESRKVGFAYGLGSVSGDSGKGTLGLTSGGELIAGKVFTLTAYVKDPAPNQKITIKLSKSLTLVGDKDTQDVPGATGFSTVTWHVKADKSGVFTLSLNSGGASLHHKIMVRPEGELYR